MRIEYFLCTLLFFFFLHALFYLFLFFLHALFLFSHALFIPFLAWFFFYKYMLLFFQLFLTYLHKKGGVVQLVERMLCTHEVIGSSPIISSAQFFLLSFTDKMCIHIINNYLPSLHLDVSNTTDWLTLPDGQIFDLLSEAMLREC